MSIARNLANLIGNIEVGGGSSNRNVIINGAMNVAQRSTSETVLGANTDTYRTVDRFKIALEGSNSGRFTMSQDSSAPEGFANSTKFECTTADTSIAAAELFTFFQIIEGQNLQHFCKGTSSAKPYAVSFYVKGNASATYVCELFDADNTRHVCKTFSVTTDWTRVELSFPADTTGAFTDDNGGSLRLHIWLHAGSNYTSGTLPATWASVTTANRAAGISSFFDSTDRTFFITGVQLEVGQNPTEFEHINNFGEELAKCQRYFEVVGASAVQFGVPVYPTNGVLRPVAHRGFQVEKRAAPTLSNIDLRYFNNGWNTSTPQLYSASVNGCLLSPHNITTSTQYLMDGSFSADAEL